MVFVNDSTLWEGPTGNMLFFGRDTGACGRPPTAVGTCLRLDQFLRGRTYRGHQACVASAALECRLCMLDQRGKGANPGATIHLLEIHGGGGFSVAPGLWQRLARLDPNLR